MTIGAILVGVSMLIIAVPFVVIPLRQRRRKEPVQTTKKLSQENKRLAVITSLSDLDFDFKIGKVSQEDYTSLRAGLVAEAAQYLLEDDKDNEIESLVQARKALKSEAPGCEKCGTPNGPGAHFCPHCGTAVKSHCPSCGKNVRAGDLFCPSCGNKVSIQVGVA